MRPCKGWAPRRASSAPPGLDRRSSVAPPTSASEVPKRVPQLHDSYTSYRPAPVLEAPWREKWPHRDTGGELSAGCLLLRVATPHQRMLTLLVRRDDFEPLACMGAAAIRWAVCCALRRTCSFGARYPLQAALLLAWPDGTSVASAPHDWDSLERFVEEGGIGLLRCSLPAGGPIDYVR